MHRKLLFFVVMINLFTASLSSIEIDTIFGSFEEDDPLVLELLESPIMDRLKDIEQHGVSYYIGGYPSFTRYDHSVGVYYLLKRFKADYNERIAGLVHDSSHTIFSHLGDFIYPQGNIKEAYQDKIVDWWLMEQNLEAIINKYQLTLGDISPKSEQFIALEQEVPNLCADRVEYLCHTAYVFGMMDKEDIQKILTDLRYEKGVWYFVNSTSAKKLGMLSLYFTEHFWGTTWNYVMNHYFSNAVKAAVEYGELSFNDIHFGRDLEALKVIEQSKEEKVKDNFIKCRQANLLAKELAYDAEEQFDFLVKTKCRGVDPFVKQDGKLKRLSEIDLDYKNYFEKIRLWAKKRVKVKMLPISYETNDLIVGRS
ncbi:MAG: hypothetical protein L7U87_00850 [Chlamydiales bacterium]|nr:hypothetical protein [Chlamydiales bacterium]